MCDLTQQLNSCILASGKAELRKAFWFIYKIKLLNSPKWTIDSDLLSLTLVRTICHLGDVREVWNMPNETHSYTKVKAFL